MSERLRPQQGLEDASLADVLLGRRSSERAVPSVLLVETPPGHVSPTSVSDLELSKQDIRPHRPVASRLQDGWAKAVISGALSISNTAAAYEADAKRKEGESDALRTVWNR